MKMENIIPTDKKCLNILILEILKEYTDEEHCLTQQAILGILDSKYAMEYDRRTVKANIESLKDLGYAIQHTSSGYYLSEREFDDAELRMLIDSVLFNKSLSHTQADRLIKKLKQLGNAYFHGKVKHICHLHALQHNSNPQTMLNIDRISDAIAQNRQISFVYNSYDINLKLQPRKADNYKYIVNPYYLVANNGRYYLIANHSRHDDISHYRVDKITNVYILDDTPARPLRTLPEYANGYDLPRHMAEHIYMFSGKSTYITMRIEPFMMDDIIDWFGKDFSILESNENHITIALHCNEEAMLYWALQYGKYVEILQPDSLREKLRSAAQNIYSKYVNPPQQPGNLQNKCVQQPEINACSNQKAPLSKVPAAFRRAPNHDNA
ncbi:WYL domain-containing protein [Anaerovibrio sp.]|uniref:helix-turn-helix transcriptional regulator n=1 Tax=Anaerovibrio sp. TaxID=1872532 RepID=UPI00262E2CCD|nr:WYL domain-containing protein [Anaerovibrio sp.]MDD6598756.1 WYL domain-containing protein [Anaerovibrio sp.]